MDFDFLMLDLDRGDIEAGDLSDVMGVLSQLLSKEAAIKFCEKVDVMCSGYDEDERELHDIPEVRRFVQTLDQHFPYWLWFLSREGTALTWLLCCLYPLAPTQEMRNSQWPAAVNRYVKERGIPYMNRICALTGRSNDEVIRLTKGAVERIVQGLTVHS